MRAFLFHGLVKGNMPKHVFNELMMIWYDQYIFLSQRGGSVFAKVENLF